LKSSSSGATSGQKLFGGCHGTGRVLADVAEVRTIQLDYIMNELVTISMNRSEWPTVT